MPLYALDDRRPQTQGQGTFWVAPDAHVIGSVILGEDVGIWFGAVLRGDNEPISIGDRTNIQEGAVLHTDSVVPPGKRLESGGLYIGNPVRRAREITEAEKARIPTMAGFYIDLKDEYRELPPPAA